MSLADLINKKRRPPQQPGSNVSRISDISISKTRNAKTESTEKPGNCAGALMADGPYLPWGPYLNAETLKQWQRELFEAIDELAKLEGWKPDDYDHTVMCIERQPASTLRPDLAHFTERLTQARAEAAAREAVDKRTWRYDR